MDFLMGKVFLSPVGQRIQKATSSSLEAENWGLNMEICDIINETDDGPKDAAKAIKRRIVGNKNFREVMLTLSVLETCVKNCGHRFQVYVCTREYVEGVLVRCILPKNNPPMVLHDRVLSLIQAWADAFRNKSSLSGVVCVYDELRRRGLEFPMTDLDALSPIHTPNRSISENGAIATAPPAPWEVSRSKRAPVALTEEQRDKLRAELDLVKENVKVMTDLLNQLKPEDNSESDTELLRRLYQVCKTMQFRVADLIPSLAEDVLLGELLVINDDLNNAFIRYERFEELRKDQSPATQPQEAENLIDLSSAVCPTSLQPVDDELDPPTAPSAEKNPGTEEEEEFDMFAQTRGSSLAKQRKSVRYEDPGAVDGLAEALDTRLQVTAAMPAQQNAVMDDIEKWLSSEVFNDFDDDEDGDFDDGVTSEEFDNFLAQRAKSIENRPGMSKSSSAPADSQPSG